MLEGVKRQIAESLRGAGISALIASICGVLLIGAAILLTISLYLWLQTRWPDHLAALATGCVLVLLAVIVLALSRSVRRSARRRAYDLPPPRDDRAGYPPDVSLRDVVDAARASPTMAIIAAFALGITAGIFSDKDRPNRPGD